jgi:hypothetical protein
MLDYFALSGYSFLFIFALLKLFENITNIFNFTANISLLGGLFCIILYYFNKITYKTDYKTNKRQKNLRLIGHSLIGLFFLLTIMPYTTSNYQYYDTFALLGHIYFVYAISQSQSELFGIFALAFYYTLATYQNRNKADFVILQLFGRLLLSIFYIVLLIKQFGFLQNI